MVRNTVIALQDHACGQTAELQCLLVQLAGLVRPAVQGPETFEAQVAAVGDPVVHPVPELVVLYQVFHAAKIGDSDV